MRSHSIVGEYELETLQIYFPCSMELQEELIRNGYKVPIETPIPIIYGNYKGYENGKSPEGVKKEAVIHPSRYGKSLKEMGWNEFRRYFKIPQERGSILRVELEEKEEKILLHLKILFRDVKPNYHLEKISYRGVAPRIWSNWAMFYIDLDDLENLVNEISNRIGLPTEFCTDLAYIKHEIQQGGQEDTYFICQDRNYYKRGLGIQAESYSFCLGCFDHVLSYFENESKKHGGKPIMNVKLRLISGDIPPLMKIGIAKMVNKHPQFMMKLVAHPDYKRRIIKLDGEEIEGKAKGRVVFCDHKDKENVITLNAHRFLRASCCIMQFFFKQDPFCSKIGKRCYVSRLRIPVWFPKKS